MIVALPDTFGLAATVPITAEPGRDLILEDLLAHEAHRTAHLVLQTLIDASARASG